MSAGLMLLLVCVALVLVAVSGCSTVYQPRCQHDCQGAALEAVGRAGE